MPTGMIQFFIILGVMWITVAPFYFIAEKTESKGWKNFAFGLFFLEFLILILWSCGAGDTPSVELIRRR